MNHDSACHQPDTGINGAALVPIHWLRGALYLSWVLIAIAILLTIREPSSWLNFLWLGIALLAVIPFSVALRSLAQHSSLKTTPKPDSTDPPGLAVQTPPAPILADLRFRQHLAYERYDALGQSLAALNIQLQTALKLWDTAPSQAYKFLTVAHEQGLTAMQEVRRSISLLDVREDNKNSSTQG